MRKDFEKVIVGTDDGLPTPITPEDARLDRIVWRKMDMYILPVATMFYLLSFLDRTNLGNARVAGIQKDLKMTDHEYSIALTVTYVPYIAAELPSNLLLRAVGPNLMLPTMLTLWGIVTMIQGFVHNYTGLLVCRFFLGLFEGGVFPGLIFYLSFFYPRQRLQLRITTFFSAATLSGAFSGLLAFGIVHLGGKGGRPAWAWIFILEGLFTVLFGCLTFFLLPGTPDKARFFNQQEKDYVAKKLKEDGAVGSTLEDKFSWKEVVEACLSPHVWFLAVIFFMSGTVLFSLAYFAPSVVRSLGYSATRTQLMTVPPFAVAFVLSMILAYVSDRYRCRGLVSLFCSVLCIVGFSMFLVSSSTRIRYVSLFLSISGTYSSASSFSTWSANNTAPSTRRATAIAISFIMTNSGGILATWLMGTLSPPPRYTKATILMLTFAAAMFVLTVLNMWYLSAQNRKKKYIRDSGLKKSEEKSGLGDRSAWFVYNL